MSTLDQILASMTDDERREFLDAIKAGRIIWCESLDDVEAALTQVVEKGDA